MPVPLLQKKIDMFQKSSVYCEGEFTVPTVGRFFLASQWKCVFFLETLCNHGLFFPQYPTSCYFFPCHSVNAVWLWAAVNVVQHEYDVGSAPTADTPAGRSRATATATSHCPPIPRWDVLRTSRTIRLAIGAIVVESNRRPVVTESRDVGVDWDTTSVGTRRSSSRPPCRGGENKRHQRPDT